MMTRPITRAELIRRYEARRRAKRRKAELDFLAYRLTQLRNAEEGGTNKNEHSNGNKTSDGEESRNAPGGLAEQSLRRADE